jgi:cation transport ATPase
MEGQSRTDIENVENSFFTTPTFQAVTIGLPFCIYKLLFGLLAWRIGLDQASDFLSACGWMIIIWAFVDLIMNLARIIFHLAGRDSPIEYCIIAQAGRLFARPRLFLAIDTLVSFSIICFVLWSGWIAHLRQEESYLWNAATTLNLISVSFVNIWMELRRSPEGK